MSEGSTGDCDGLGAGRGCRSPNLYDSRSWGQGLETGTDSDPEDIDKYNHFIYGNVSIGNLFGIRIANGKGETLDTVQIVANLFIDNYFQVWTWLNWNPVITNFEYKNNISIMYEQTDSRTRELYLQDSATNGDWMDGWVAGINNNYWTEDPIECTYTGTYTQADCDIFDDVTDQHGTNPTEKRDDAYWQEFATTAAVLAAFTTSQLYLESTNNDAIGNGVDLLGTASCADIDNLDDNCGLVMDSSTDWEDLTSMTKTFDWEDQGDTDVDMGPWTYASGDPGLPADEASFGGGAIIGGGASLGGN
jgi:hypothetical protein